MSKKLAIGIDFGTSYCCVSVFRNGRVEVIPNDRGNRTTPSCVAFTDTEWLVGEAATSQASVNPRNTIFDIKNLIGLRSASISNTKYRANEITQDKNNHTMIRVAYKNETKELYIEQILALIFAKLKAYAEAYLKQDVTEAVIAFPATFNFFQRQAIKDAADVAGLSVLLLVMEPMAVAFAYNFEKNIQEERTVLTFDCGGGFTNVSILAIEYGILEHKTAACDTHLGGEHFVDRLLVHFINEFKRKFKKDLSKNERSVYRLRKACEEAKRTLSFSLEACIDIEYLFEGISFYTKITRSKFEEICADLFENVMKPVQKAISDSKLTASNIQEVILVGGSSRIPKIQKLLEDLFGKLSKPVNQDEAVACGGAIKAAILSSVRHPLTDDLLDLSIIGLSIGIETAGGMIDIILKRNTTIPCKVRHSFSLQNVDGFHYLEKIHSGEEKKLYRIECDTGFEIPICVFEGERAVAVDNTLIDMFHYPISCSRSPRELKLEVTFDCDRNRHVFVSITEIGNDASEMKRYLGEKNSWSGELEKMIEDSEKFNRDFVEQKATIVARADLENYALSVKSEVEDEKQNCQKVLTKCVEIINLLENETHLDGQEIEQHQNELEEMCRPVVKILYPNDSTDQEAHMTKSTTSSENRLKETETQLKELETKFNASSHREKELTTQVTSLESSVTELNSIIKLLESETVELESSKRNLTERLETSEANARNLADRLAQAEARNQELGALARNIADRLAQAEARNQELETRLSQESQPFWVVSRAEIQMTEEEIGRGGWGAIKIAVFRGQKVAAKMLHNEIISPNNIRLFSREMTMFSRVHHPNIVQFLGATREGTPIILLELMHTSLRSELGKTHLPRNLVLSIMSDVARALNYLHLFRPRPIIHRDVSSANVLLDPAVPPIIWKAKLSDFGSTNFVSNQATAGPGSPLYAAPEAFNPYQQTPKMDVFSFGAVLIEACTREMPSVEDREELMGGIAWVQVVPLIRRCMQVNQDDRPSMEGVLTELAQLQRTV